jgi:hypothetical protein
MKNLLASIILVMTFAGLATANNAGNKDVIGTWKYSVPSAPEGLTTGDIVIKEAEGVLTGKVVFQDGNSVDLKNLKYEEGQLSFGLYVESNYVSVKAKVTGKKMEGQVDSPDGQLNFTAQQPEKK